jgi:hypothetical protein
MAVAGLAAPDRRSLVVAFAALALGATRSATAEARS